MTQMAPLRTRLMTLLLLWGMLLCPAETFAAMDARYSLVGLGLHQETGRDIYLGGLYTDKNTPQADKLSESNAPRIMEYRVIARRTSIRSLLGGMLLQSEVATGKPASTQTTTFANRILSGVKGSLYAGDALQIELTAQRETVARLNGLEMARSEGQEPANYLLFGWVNQNGPSSSFRAELLADSIDPTLLSNLRENQYSPARKEVIVSWLAPAEVDPGAVASVLNSAAAPQPTAANTGQQTTAQTPAIEQQMPAVEPLAAIEQLAGGPAKQAVAEVTSDAPFAADLQNPVGIEEAPVLVASLAPAAGEPPETSAYSDILALNVQEYSQRLSAFHSTLVAMVYKQIRYPKRAIRRSLQGRLELDITLRPDGELVSIEIASSSGFGILDDAAIEAARQALSNRALNAIDPVAVAEFSDGARQVVVPVPVNFKLTE